MNQINKILKLVNKSDYIKGYNFKSKNIKVCDKFKQSNLDFFHYEVDSQYYGYYYDIFIGTFNGNVQKIQCDCMQFMNYHSCKHVAACLRLFGDEIFKKTIDPKKISLNIINDLKQTKSIKKQVNVEINIILNSYPQINIRIGENKLYSLNNKLAKFIEAYNRRIKEVDFGKEFTYNKDNYYFNDIDQKIIEYIIFYKRTHPSSNSKLIDFDNDNFKEFLKLLKDKEFNIAGIGKINGIKEENVLSTNLSKENNLYTFKFSNNKLITEDGEYVLKDNILYHTPNEVVQILKMMNDNYINELVFKENELDNFSKAILPRVKENIEVDEKIKDKIIIVSKPKIKLFFDFKSTIICKFDLVYKDREINYFDKVDNILRDINVEEEVIEDLKKYNFIIENSKIYIKDIEDIGNFLENGLNELVEKYEVFTSQKLKDTNIKKNVAVKSSFGIGKDNIMKYQFDLGDIKNDELVGILDSLRSNKKYYKLKSGDLLNLEENDNLKELNNLVDDLEISNKDINNGFGIIPKYQAIYLDSLDYNIIETNNLFKELIGKFNNFKKIKLNIKDKVLRDYQVTGVKWLYNIYKCGFGGILADEMGLGKSIQLIYLVKQILKEKDCKILIVSPTSLIYNWQKEFDKFGSELKYKVIAESKEKRNELLNNLDDTNVLITTYGLVRQDLEKYLEMNFELVVIDEAQNIKNPNALMTKAIKQIKANTKIALTGTPIENSVLELWSIFDFIMPGYLANINKFQKKYNLKNVESEELKKLDTLNKQIKPFILRRLKKDVVKELPDKIENNIYIELNESQKKLYAAQVEKTNNELEELINTEGFTKARFKILQLLTKLRQICIDPKIIYEDYKGGSSKIEYLVDLVKDIVSNNHKILLFTSYKTALDIVNQEFGNNDISTYVIDGSTKSKKRMELVEKFNKDDTNVFLIMLKAGGTGLNLTSADVVIHLDLWWNPQVENQATDRAHRIGQKNNVEVIKLICRGTIEERILELQNKKKILADKLIDENKLDENMLSKLTEKDIKKLISFDKED